MNKHLERLNNVFWDFRERDLHQYASVEEFKKDVILMNEELQNEKEWQLDDVVIEEPKIEVTYTAYVFPDDLLSNERLASNEVSTLEDNETIFERESEEYDGRYYAEITATIEPNNGQCFSGYEFLMKVHIQTLNKDLGDDNFYEGVEITRNKDNTAIAYIYTGG